MTQYCPSCGEEITGISLGDSSCICPICHELICKDYQPAYCDDEDSDE